MLATEPPATSFTSFTALLNGSLESLESDANALLSAVSAPPPTTAAAAALRPLEERLAAARAAVGPSLRIAYM